MKSKMIWANFAVENLDRTTEFYTNLGFRSNGRSNELTSFFFSDTNFVIHFFLKDILEKNINVLFSKNENLNEIIFTLSAGTKEEIDKWAENVKNEGGKIESEPKEFGDNYYGFTFSDPDGHKFNVFMM
ncbi:VOC family protein [Chryseobacterium chendengshani]|uniref:VOC family protein n=1 Tax=Chryseobacterium sp. LJ756 TaxID=2864113 RepID=UPI001C643521|nr:VOC family protein [Chryseobacterium sp. LJ756]MBW7676972.1 VOC family protein [Chryseobacterium sp. LJ756]